MGLIRKGFAALAAATAAVLVSSVPNPALAAIDNHARAITATGYIASQQKANGSIPAFSPIGSTADAVVSLVAAHRGLDEIRKGLNYLGRQVTQNNVTTVGLEAKVVMAAVAGGRSPRSFGGTNLVKAIASTEHPDGQYFDPGSFAAVFDDALAMLALESAGATPSGNAKQWLIDAQCTDGGWQYDAPPQPGEDLHCFTGNPNTDYSETDTNTTSYVIQALQAANAPSPAYDPLAFFASIRDSVSHGWGYTWGFQSTDANSTALVLQAFAAAAISPPSGAMAALRGLQNTACGAFSFANGTGPDIGATIGGVMGLLQRPLPVRPAATIKPAPITPDCP